MSTQFFPLNVPADPATSNAPTIDLPHFVFPFRRGANGHVNVVEQDTIAHIMSCETVIAYCPLGARQERPEFGWDWPIYNAWPINTTSLEQALATFEPRGTISNVQELANQVGTWERDVQVQIEIRSDT
jgi:phage baseplate assembly protein W